MLPKLLAELRGHALQDVGVRDLGAAVDDGDDAARTGPGPRRDVAVINAAAGIVAAGLADGFAEGTARAGAAIDSGAAAGVLDRVVARSQELAAE